LEETDERLLQIDHRIPYEVGGDGDESELNPEEFMLLSGSANRAKSWSCEHCENWNTLKDKNLVSQLLLGLSGKLFPYRHASHT
jgi:hypothetical protein